MLKRVTAHLKGARLQQADLVVLRQVPEAGDLLGELHHFPYGGREAVGELLPHLVASLVQTHVRRYVHWTNLRTDSQSQLRTTQALMGRQNQSAEKKLVKQVFAVNLTRYILLPLLHSCWTPGAQV